MQKLFRSNSTRKKNLNHQGKNKTDIDNLKKDHKEIMKNNKLILKTQQRFKSEKENVFTEEVIRLL